MLALNMQLGTKLSDDEQVKLIIITRKVNKKS